METITREDLVEEPIPQVVMNKYDGWLFKIKQSRPISPLKMDDTFWYEQDLYQIKQVSQVSASTESYTEAHCLIVGVMPPRELLPR